MNQAIFHSSDFTPFGYLRNPFAVARSWEEGEGKGPRATLERPGFGWEYPWPRRPTAGAGLELGCRLGERSWKSRAEFAELGYCSTYHSCLVFSYDWSLPGLDLHARFLLAERDVLLCVVDSVECEVRTAEERPSPFALRTSGSAARLHIGLRGWRRNGRGAARLVGQDGLLDLGEGLPPHWLILDSATAEHGPPVVDSDGVTFTVPLGGGPGQIVAALARGPEEPEAGRAVLARASRILFERLAEDRVFWATSPRLEGGWPLHWRNGWVYDLETTRMLLFLPGGIFTDVWPAWMVDWPRAVLAELLPHLEAYLRWWLAERTDEQGWVVYKCTWESGEDASPRLDPAREGDHVISAYTRPVELQATMSQSAGILAFFARELGREATASTWQRIAAAYRRRAQQLWDEHSGRFRDWDKRRNAFITPSAVSDYWGSDPTRFSPLSLTPPLFDLATPAQPHGRREGSPGETAVIPELPSMDGPSSVPASARPSTFWAHTPSLASVCSPGSCTSGTALSSSLPSCGEAAFTATTMERCADWARASYARSSSNEAIRRCSSSAKCPSATSFQICLCLRSPWSAVLPPYYASSIGRFCSRCCRSCC